MSATLRRLISGHDTKVTRKGKYGDEKRSVKFTGVNGELSLKGFQQMAARAGDCKLSISHPDIADLARPVTGDNASAAFGAVNESGYTFQNSTESAPDADENNDK